MDPVAAQMADYLIEMRRQNVATIGAGDVFVRRTASGDLRQVVRGVQLSLVDGTLYQLPDRWERLMYDPKNPAGPMIPWVKGQGAYVSVPVVSKPWRATVSAEGFLRMNGVAGCSVQFPRVVLVDGMERANPYIERNEDDDIVRIVIQVYVVGATPDTGNIAAVQYLLDIDPRLDLLHMLSGVLKGRGRPKKDAKKNDEDEDEDAFTANREAKLATSAVILMSRLDYNEWRGEMPPEERRRWHWIRVQGPIGYAHDLTNPAVTACFDKYLGIIQNAVKKAQTVAIRNAMKKHPALARHEVALGPDGKTATVAVTGWTGADRELDRYKAVLDALARGERIDNVEVIDAAETYDPERDQVGDLEVDAPAVVDTDETEHRDPAAAERVERNDLVQQLDAAVLLLRPSEVATVGYDPATVATVSTEALRTMLEAAQAMRGAAGRTSFQMGGT